MTVPQISARASVRLSRGDLAVVLGAFSIALVAYVRTAAPGIVAEGDCSEYVAAASVAGIPHAPGYPTYMLFAAGLAELVPLEHLARALNLASAFFGAATVGLVALLALRLARRAFPESDALAARGAALLAALLLGGATEFWDQSLGAEVYTLGTALLALCLELLLTSAQRPRARLAAALVAGLAVGVHYAVGLPCALLVAASAWRARRAPGPAAPARLVGAFALGLATFLYLPLRSRADPALDFGDPETPARFWRMLTLADMPTGKDLARPFGLLLQQLAALGGLAAGQWPDWTFALIGCGLVGLASRRALWAPGAALIGLFALNYAGILAMANFALVDEEIYELRFLFLPAYLVVALFGGLGFACAGAFFARRARLAGPILGLAILAALVPWWIEQAGRLDKSDDRVMSEYGRALIDEADGPAVLFTFGDNAWMALTYQQIVLGERGRDVAIVAARLLSLPWYRAQLLRRHPELVIDEDAPGVAGMARSNLGRANLYHTDPRVHGLRGFQEVPDGLLMRILPEGAQAEPVFRSPPPFSPHYAVLDMRERSIRADILQAHARAASWYRAHGQASAAERVLQLGLLIAPPEPRMEEFHLARCGLLLELGDLLAARGKASDARSRWQGACDEAPGSPPAELARKRLEGFGRAPPK